MYKFASACGLITLVTLTGCATVPCGDSHAYQNSTIDAPLKAPPGMTVPAPDPTYRIPGKASTTGKRTDRDASGACIAFPPAVVSGKSTADQSGSTSQSATQPGTTKPAAAPKPATPTSTPSPAPAVGSSAKPAVATGGPIG